MGCNHLLRESDPVSSAGVKDRAPAVEIYRGALSPHPLAPPREVR